MWLLDCDSTRHCLPRSSQAFPDGCFWFESSGFTNWTLSNNTFRGCDYGAGHGAADVVVAACAPAWDGNGEPTKQGSPVAAGQPFANVTIDSCLFDQDTCVHPRAHPHPCILHPRAHPRAHPHPCILHPHPRTLHLVV